MRLALLLLALVLSPPALARTIGDAIAPPDGFRRVAVTAGGFDAYLRGLPLRPEGTPVETDAGVAIRPASAVVAVVDIDLIGRNLQQCADAIIRLRAEWARSRARQDLLDFPFTSGDRLPYAAYLGGRRPVPRGTGVIWKTVATQGDSDQAFRAWLALVMTYAGTLSLDRMLLPATGSPRIGDVLIEPGSPGHAMLIVDLATDGKGHHVALLAQSYMPAQSFHIVARPGGDGAWYDLSAVDGGVATPDWRFGPSRLRRFP